MTVTIGNIVERYRDTYSLHGLKGDLPQMHHDAMHAMTGLGIGGLDEVRLSAVIAGVINKPVEIVLADNEKNMDRMRSIFTGQVHAYHSDFSPFENRKTAFAHTHVQNLGETELRALHEVGQKLGEKIEQHLGVSYRQARPELIAGLPEQDFDVSAQVQAIKAAQENPQNRRVERVVRNILEENAIQKTGQSQIPAHGTSWKAPKNKGPSM